MIQVFTGYDAIVPEAWDALVERSAWATWFQTREAYLFYSRVPQEMTPFAFGVEENGVLTGVIAGYLTRTQSVIKQFVTRRAIIIGGALLDEHISDDALVALLSATRCELQRKAIYIELRNFNDYSRWKEVFRAQGFDYQPHLNFHVDTTSVEAVEQHLSKSRKRNIKTAVREGVVSVSQPTIEQVREYYAILQRLYKTKVKTPLFSWSFFEQLYNTPNGHFFLAEYQSHIIGGTACVCLPGKAVYEWFVCGADDLYEHIFPSSYATYLGIRYAAENGFSVFDMMGAGKPDEAYGVRDFKARFGGEQVEHGRFVHVCNPCLYHLGEFAMYILSRNREYI